MIKGLFQAIEALFKATTYLLVLIIGLTVTGLGAYIVLFLAFRIAQFLYELLFKAPWI